MWVSDSWVDFSLLDCSDGERLEQWGPFTLARPDPQVIWHTTRRHPAWRHPDARYVRSHTGGGSWEAHRLPASWEIRYGSYIFIVKPMNFKHTGLFPEQAVNWDWLAGQIRTAGRPIRLLNLFAYTGGATVAAAAAGAEVCHVDAARGMVALARENAAASGLSHKPIRWIVDDCRDFVTREIKRGRRYDALVLDPPSFGRGTSGDVWKLEDDLYHLLILCAGILSDKPLCVLLNSYTAGLAPGVLTCLLRGALPSGLGGRVESAELGLPIRENGWILPCGATARLLFNEG